ncbi:hypothetical protein HGM15179_011879, partial [Zosterops borbonicus]
YFVWTVWERMLRAHYLAPHWNPAGFCSLRRLWGQAGLARIQAASQENAQKILAVQ